MPSILIVEDEGIVAKDLQQSLIEMGYDAFAIAASAEEALACASVKRPDIALMDIRIKGHLDGIDTAAMLQDRYQTSVIYLTAHADAAIVVRAKQTEPYGYLLKPVKTAELRILIDIAIYKRQAVEANRRAAQLKLEKDAAHEMNRLKSEFIANVSHELRTPLNGVIGFASLLLDGPLGAVSEPQRECLEMILKSGRRFAQMVNNMVDLSKLESSMFERHPGPLNLPAIVAEVVTSLQESIDEKAHTISLNLDPSVANGVNDADTVKQIVFNYLANAIKFTPNGGLIAVRTAPVDGTSVRIEISDSGPGVPAADIGRLFTTFGPLDSSSRKEFQGAGLGLAVTRRLAELQGGRVGAEPVAAGGMTFFAVLPWS